MKAIRKNLPAIVILLFLGTVVYLNTFHNQFVYDDLVTVQENIFIRDLGNLKKLFSRNYYLLSEEYSFRPLVTATYFWDHFCWGADPRGYHFSNLLLHLLTGLAVYYLAAHLFQRGPATLLTALIFVSHPVQTEAVAAISFREDLLCALFFCLALIFYSRDKAPSYLLSLLCFVLALLSKEMAIVFPLTVVAYELLIKGRNLKNLLRPKIVLFLLLSMAYSLGRLSLLYNRDSLPAAPEFGEPLTRLLLTVKGLGLYGRLVFFPVNLTVEYPDPFPPLVWGRELLPAALLTPAFLLAVWLKGRKNPVVRFGLTFFLLGLLPVLNLVPTARLGAERFLYLPLIGFSLWGAGTLTGLLAETGRRRVAWAAIVLIFFFWSAGAVNRNRAWRDNLALFSEAVSSSPRSSKAHHGLGNEYFRRGNLLKAIREFEEAISIFPREPLYYNSLGVAYGQLGEFDRSRAQFQASARLNPGDPLVNMNLSTLYLRMGDFPQALLEINRYIAARPFDPKGYLNLGEVYLAMDDYRSAVAAYGEVLRRDPSSLLALSSIGYCYYRLGDYQKAKLSWEKALRLNPGDPELKYNLQVLSTHQTR